MFLSIYVFLSFFKTVIRKKKKNIYNNNNRKEGEKRYYDWQAFTTQHKYLFTARNKRYKTQEEGEEKEMH